MSRAFNARSPLGRRQLVPVRGAKAPRQPTREEVDTHNRSGHLPRRRWCEICIRASCVASPHSTASSSSSRSFPALSCDYCYPGATKAAELERVAKANAAKENGEPTPEDEFTKGSRPTFILHDSDSGAIYALEVSRKGPCFDAITRICHVLDQK